MYHCHIQFYLISRRKNFWGVIKAVPPGDSFSHAFLESDEPEAELLAQADVIFADMEGRDAEGTLQTLLAGKKEDAELILAAGREQAEALSRHVRELRDIWTEPLGEAELRFHFLKWQEQYKQEKDLWQAEHFLDACIDGSPNLVWYKTKDGIHEKVNDSFCRTVNKSKAQVQGRGHAYIWNVEHDDPACIESELEVMRRRETCQSEERIQTGDGERMLTTYKSPLYDLDGSVMGTVGVAVDVTRERIFEEEVWKKKQTLERLFATMDCGVMCHTVDGKRLISINQAALQILGYSSAEELVDDGFYLVAQSVMEEDKPKLRSCIQALKHVGESTNTEYRVKHKDGQILYIIGNVKLIEENGELMYQRYLIDATVQKREEAERWAQKDQEFQYQERIFQIFATFLSENIDDIYMMLDPAEEKIEFVTPNIQRILGVSPVDLGAVARHFGKSFVKYVTGQSVGWEGLKALKPGTSLPMMETERINQRTGEHRWFQESVHCVQVQDRPKVAVYISDRTKERKTQDTLTAALDIAQVANKAKSSFLSSVSHDIRTPMNAIMGLVTLLKEESENPERVKEYSEKISAASQHLLGLINDVLDMNKIESGSAVLNLSEMDLASVVNELNIVIRPQARAKNQDFEIQSGPLTNEHLIGDRLRISQILLNILSNAVKYTPEGGQITMRVQELPQVDPNYSRIRFTISDNGRGMSEEYQQVIFDPFTREDNAATGEVQGTGLGMAITKSLVDLMHGSIAVESTLGEGSTFTVELELRVQQQDNAPQFWNQYGVKKTIVVDDDQEICEDILRKMADTGVVVEYATSGAKAMEMMRTAWERGEPYDIMLLDWRMPELSGLETARLIRKDYPDKIPILLFSAYDWLDIKQEASEVGIDDYLSKPFFMSNYKDAIRRMLDKKPGTSGQNVLKDKHVMVVDDIEINRMILAKILSTMGAKCDMAENGKEAVDIFTSSEPGDYDLIMMDIQMPEMTGYEATRAIRSSGHPSAQSVAIIAMTANAFVDDVRRAIEAGMDAHIPKPIVLEQLKNTIEEVFLRKEEERGEEDCG